MIKGIDCPGVAVIFFCHDGNGRYLLHKRSANARDEQGCWDVGGGSVEHGELLEDALRREIQEEYGAEIIDHEFLGFREVHRIVNGTPTHWIAFDFKVHIDPSRVSNGDPQKIDEIDWFEITSLPDPLHSQIPTALSNYMDKL